MIGRCWILGAGIALPMVAAWQLNESQHPIDQEGRVNILASFNPLVALILWLIVTVALTVMLFWLASACAWALKTLRP